MEKVQTGQVIEFYSNSCLVKTNLGEFNCIAIKNIVVGDFVQLEIIQDSKKPLGKITKVNKRSSVLSRRDGNKNKLFAANVTHVGILVTPNPKTTTEFIDKWILKTKLSNIEPFILNNKIDLVINTTEGTQSIKDSASIRQSALRNKIFCTTTMFGASAVIDALQNTEDNWTYNTLQEINKL